VLTPTRCDLTRKMELMRPDTIDGNFMPGGLTAPSDGPTLQNMKRAFARITALASAVGLLAAVPRPRPDFSSFKFYIGTWACSPNANGRPISHTALTTIGFDGMWMIERDAPPGVRYLTYDKSIERWVEVGVSRSGGYWIGSSPGWHGDTILFTTKWLDGSWQIDAITKDSNTRRHDNYHGIDAKGQAYSGASYCIKTKA
jgi:hypothetical protein